MIWLLLLFVYLVPCTLDLRSRVGLDLLNGGRTSRCSFFIYKLQNSVTLKLTEQYIVVYCPFWLYLVFMRFEKIFFLYWYWCLLMLLVYLKGRVETRLFKLFGLLYILKDLFTLIGSGRGLFCHLDLFDHRCLFLSPLTFFRERVVEG